jgi:hypothetical protein
MISAPDAIVNEDHEMDMGRFKVDQYMPKDIQRDKDYVNGDLTFMKKYIYRDFSTSSKAGENMEESDKTSRDFMTSILEAIQQIIPSQNDQDFENAYPP